MIRLSTRQATQQGWQLRREGGRLRVVDPQGQVYAQTSARPDVVIQPRTRGVVAIRLRRLKGRQADQSTLSLPLH